MNEKNKKIRGRLTRIILLICLLGGTICFLCLSPMFNIQEIVVEQNSKIASDTIASLSGIQLYKNIFLFKKSDAITNIERNSYVNSVKISRSLPNKIKIIVEERTEKYFDDCVNRWLHDNESKVDIKEIKLDIVYDRHGGNIKYIAIILYENKKEERELEFGLC